MLESLTSETLMAFTSDGWNTPENMKWLQSLAEDGRSIVLKDGGNRHFFVAEGKTPQSVWNDVLQRAREI